MKTTSHVLTPAIFQREIDMPAVKFFVYLDGVVKTLQCNIFFLHIDSEKGKKWPIIFFLYKKQEKNL